MLAGIAAMLPADKTFLFGDSVSIADIALLVLFEAGAQWGFDVAAAAPSLKRVADAVTAHPKLAAYFAARTALEAKEKEAAAEAEAKAKAGAGTA